MEMNKEVQDALQGAQMFYFIFHGTGILVLMSYDNILRHSLIHLEFAYPIYFLTLLNVTIYFFLTTGRNPGIAPKIEISRENNDQSENKSQNISNNDQYSSIKVGNKEPESSIGVELQSGPIKESDVSQIHTQNEEKQYTSQRENQRILDDNIKPLPDKFFCSRCNYTQNYRTRHCKRCDVCVSKFDHHCFWIGGCVGELNHRKFIIFCYIQTWTMIECIQIFWHDMIDNDENNQYYVFLAFLLICLGFFIFTGILSLYHTYLLLTNQTTWEQQSKDKISYLKIYPRGFYPFDKGIIENIKMFFCHGNKIRKYEMILKSNQKLGTAIIRICQLLCGQPFQSL